MMINMQCAIVVLSTAFIALLFYSCDFVEIRKIFVKEGFWDIDIVEEKHAFKDVFVPASGKWESWELVLLGAAACLIIVTCGWSINSLQAFQGKQIEKKVDDYLDDFENVVKRVKTVETSVNELINNMTRLTESLNKLESTPVEMLYHYSRDMKTEDENASLLTNDDSTIIQTQLDTEILDTEVQSKEPEDTEVKDLNSCSLNAECHYSPPRPDTPATDPLSWYSESEKYAKDQMANEKSCANDVEVETIVYNNEYEKPAKLTELTISEPLPLPVGCGEAGRGQTKRIPQYQGYRKNLRSRGKESEENSPRKEQSYSTPRKQRAQNQK